MSIEEENAQEWKDFYAWRDAQVKAKGLTKRELNEANLYRAQRDAHLHEVIEKSAYDALVEELAEVSQSNSNATASSAELAARVRELEKICKEKDAHRDHLITRAVMFRSKAEGLVEALNDINDKCEAAGIDMIQRIVAEHLRKLGEIK